MQCFLPALTGLNQHSTTGELQHTASHGKQGGCFTGQLSWAPSGFPDVECPGNTRAWWQGAICPRGPPGMGTQVPGRLGAPTAVRGGGSRRQPRGASCAPAHRGEQTERVRQISAHTSQAHVFSCPLPHAELHADIKATAKRQLVRDPLIYVTPNAGRSKLGGGGKDVSVAAFHQEI